MPMCGQCVPHVAREGLWPCGTRGPHVATPSLAVGQATSRAPLAFFSRIRASELRIRIRFRITNRDSLTHDKDYETLKNGWEFISENDDEHNSTNENEK